LFFLVLVMLANWRTIEFYLLILYWRAFGFV
jgi:hypothetical protein